MHLDFTRRMRWLTVLAVVLVAWVAPAHAQQPQPLLDANGEVREEAYDYLSRPLGAEDRKYESIRGGRLKELMNEVVAFSRLSRDAGDRQWGRMAGGPYEAMTADWSQAIFEELGMENIRRQYFDLPPQWTPVDWEFTATGGDRQLTFGSLLPASGSSPVPEGTQLEAVWVGSGSEADFLNRDVQGKAVVLQTILAPGQMSHSANWEGATVRAEENGAAMIIGIWGYAGNMAVWQGLGGTRTTRTNADGTTTTIRTPIEVPGFFMGWDDGKRLRDLIGTGARVMIDASLDVEIRENLSSPSVFGTLPGTTDERIYVMSHMDGYFDAALDNASGMAVMMALAEHFARIPPSERRRDITFIATAGHHVGSPNAAFLRDNPETLERVALMINCEHIAPTQFVQFGNEIRRTTTVSPRRWWVHGSDQVLDIVLDAYRTFGVSLVGRMDPRATGEMGQIEDLAPSIQLIRSPEHKHTDLDVPELVSGAGMEAVARAFAKIVDGVNTLAIEEIVPASLATDQQ